MHAAMDDAGGLRIVYQQDTAAARRRARALRLRRRLRAAGDRGRERRRRRRGGGVLEKDGRWRALAPGEFVLGYPDEDTRVDPKRRLPDAPADPLGKSGTYMVWRKLAPGRRAVAARPATTPRSSTTAATRTSSRRRSSGAGTTARRSSRTPTSPTRASTPTARGANDFRYDDDLDGRRCPVGAHIRRSNPRDALGFDGRAELPPPDDPARDALRRRRCPTARTTDDGADRGLVFVSFQASISRQFEGVQMQWLNDGNIFGLGHDKDFLLGDADGTGQDDDPGRPAVLPRPAGERSSRRAAASTSSCRA